MGRSPMLVVVCTLALTAVAAGQGDGQDTAPTPNERPRARLLHMTGGAVLRGDSRWRVDRWEIRAQGGWQPLPVGAVVESRLERDVLDEARRRRSGARRKDPSARVGIAEWMAAEGLLTEAFRELDEVLQDDRDQTDALALLAGDSLPVALPAIAPAGADIEEAKPLHLALMDWSARMPPTLHEMAVSRVHPDDALHDAAVAGLRARAAGTRRFAALVLRRHYSDRAHPELLRRALLDPAADVRAEAARALRDGSDAESLAICLDALGHESALVRTHAAETLGVMGASAAVEPLIGHLAVAGTARMGPGGRRAQIFIGTQRAFVQGYDANVATRAAIADPIIGTVQAGASLDARVLATGSVSGSRERAAVRTSLRNITGARPGSSASAWRRWWDRNGEQWLADHPLASRAGQPAVVEQPMGPWNLPPIGDAW